VTRFAAWAAERAGDPFLDDGHEMKELLGRITEGLRGYEASAKDLV
jgi:hypothetical protein